MLAEHQTEAADKALALLEVRGAVLLADEVGLGKSFIAAEVMRRSPLPCELIVPAALVQQWTQTLDEFGVDATLLTHDGIVSAPFMPQPVDRLVVVDEAHAFRNPKTQRYAALARRTIAARLLLITATPVCNAARDFEALFRLMARDDLLRDRGIPSIDAAFATRDREAVASIAGELMIRRDRTVLPADLQFGELERRVVRHAVAELPIIDELRFPLVGAAPLLRRFLRRRLESSEAALLESVRRQRHFYQRALASIASGRTLSKRDYRAAFAGEEDAAEFQEVLFWELFAPEGSAAGAEEIRAEMRRLDELAEYVRRRPDAKREMLAALLRASGKPAIVFTGSAATASSLAAALRREFRCGLVTSRTRSREAVIASFLGGRIDLMISTDMSAEGLNLQRAGVVVHYDIPWNPVKLEQRNGRAHRIGQKGRSVAAIYFLPESRATGIVEIVARKNRLRRRIVSAARGESAVAAATMRPRLTRDAAFPRLRSRWSGELPSILQLRHRAGLEMLIAEMSREYLDETRIGWLVELASREWNLARGSAGPHAPG